MNKFQICDRCKRINVKSLSQKIKKLDSDAQIEVGCVNMCGIGRTKCFVILNHIPIIADTEEQLIKNIKEQLIQKK